MQNKKLLATILTIFMATGAFAAKPVKAEAANDSLYSTQNTLAPNEAESSGTSDDSMYAAAFTLTKKALDLKTQAAINDAKRQLQLLPKSLDWAKPEFSKQLDIVQNDIMGNAITAYYKALETAKPEDINIVNQKLDDIKTSEDSSISSWSDNLRGQVNFIVYNHAINEVNKTTYSLPNVFKSIKDDKRLKVAFWGDSITEGANNNLADTYPQLFVDNMKTMMPDVNVEYTNFALGQRNTYNAVDDKYTANNPETPWSPYAANVDFWRDWSVQGKSWKQHIVDYKPDLLFIAFGMNDAININLLDYDYISNLLTMISYVKENSPGTDIVLVTNILSTENKALYNQSTEHTLQIARATREFAKTHDIPLVDTNRLWSILLYGKDDDAFYPEEISDINNMENTKLYNGEFQIKLNKTSGLDKDTEIAVRSNGSEGGLKFNFNESNGSNLIDFYSMDKGMDKPGVKLGSVEAEDVNTIKLDGSIITINGSNFILYKHLIDGAISFPNGSDNISSIKLTQYKSLSQVPLYNELDMLGNPQGGTSGNGINHPTALGTKLSYYAACGSIINSIKNQVSHGDVSTGAQEK